MDNILTTSSLDLHKEKEYYVDKMQSRGENQERKSERKKEKGNFSDFMNAIQLQRMPQVEEPPCPRDPKTLIWSQLTPVWYSLWYNYRAAVCESRLTAEQRSSLPPTLGSNNSGGLCLREERRSSEQSIWQKERWRTNSVIDRRGESSLIDSSARANTTAALLTISFYHPSLVVLCSLPFSPACRSLSHTMMDTDRHTYHISPWETHTRWIQQHVQQK